MDDLARASLAEGIDNATRASWAENALRAFAEQTGQIGSGCFDHDRQSVIGDLLCNLMHLCDQDGIDFEQCLATGRMHHEAEKSGPEDEETAHAAGWEFGGDAPGFWFHQPTWGTWKAATSWAGTNNEPTGDDAKTALYDTLEELIAGEEL